MNVAVSLLLPQEVEEQFLPLKEHEREDLLTQLLIEWADKQARKKRRDDLMKNPSPINKKYAGFLKRALEAQGDYKNYTDEDVAKAKDDYLTEKYGV